MLYLCTEGFKGWMKQDKTQEPDTNDVIVDVVCWCHAQVNMDETAVNFLLQVNGRELRKDEQMCR